MSVVKLFIPPAEAMTTIRKAVSYEQFRSADAERYGLLSGLLNGFGVVKSGDRLKV